MNLESPRKHERFTNPVASPARYVALLRAGGVLACPTETQFGLLADAFNPAAVKRVCHIKRRPEAAALALLLPDWAALDQVATFVSASARDLAHAYWPGPLTLLVRARAGLPAEVTSAGNVGVRVPGPSTALTLCRAFGGPLTATSANRSGEPVVASSEEAVALFGDELAAVVPGEAGGGPPSTIVDVTGTQPKLVRAGAIPWPPPR